MNVTSYHAALVVVVVSGEGSSQVVMILLILLSVLMKRVLLLGVEGINPALLRMMRSSSGLRRFRNENTSPFALFLMVHIWSRLVTSSEHTLFTQKFQETHA